MDKKKLIVRIFAGILAAILLLGLITPAFAAEADATQPQDSVVVAEGEDSSVGIIGGADGPTAVFVTTSPIGGLLTTILLIAGAVCFAAAIATVFKKKRK